MNETEVESGNAKARVLARGKRTVTTKEMFVPAGLVLTLITSAWSVALNYGRTEAKYEAVNDIKQSLVKIEKKIDDQDGHYLETYKQAAGMEARLAAIEKAFASWTDTQTAMNSRFLGHLEASSKGAK